MKIYKQIYVNGNWVKPQGYQHAEVLNASAEVAVARVTLEALPTPTILYAPPVQLLMAGRKSVRRNVRASSRRLPQGWKPRERKSRSSSAPRPAPPVPGRSMPRPVQRLPISALLRKCSANSR